MEYPKSNLPRSFPSTGLNVFQMLFVGLLNLMEVSFDLLALLTAFLGGLRLGGESTAVVAVPVQTTEKGEDVDAAPTRPLTLRERLAKAPAGVKFIAVFWGLLGLLECIFGTLLLIASLLGVFAFPLRTLALGGALGVMYLVLGLVKIFLTGGLLLLKRWAFWVTVGVVIFNLISGVIAITQPETTAWTLLSDMLLPLVVLFYFLISKRARAAFHI